MLIFIIIYHQGGRSPTPRMEPVSPASVIRSTVTVFLLGSIGYVSYLLYRRLLEQPTSAPSETPAPTTPPPTTTQPATVPGTPGQPPPPPQTETDDTTFPVLLVAVLGSLLFVILLAILVWRLFIRGRVRRPREEIESLDRFSTEETERLKATITGRLRRAYRRYQKRDRDGLLEEQETLMAAER